MKCLATYRDNKSRLTHCDKRTHWAISTRLSARACAQHKPNADATCATCVSGYAYELRYCPEHYEQIIGPAPPAIKRGEAVNYPVLLIEKKAPQAPETLRSPEGP